LARGSTNTLV
jgi:hypothetical protein